MITNMTKTAAMDALIANDIDGYEPGWDLRGLRGDTKPTGATVPNGVRLLKWIQATFTCGMLTTPSGGRSNGCSNLCSLQEDRS